MSGINEILADILKFEKEVKRRFDKHKANVLIQNAKTDVDYELGKGEGVDQMRWHVTYREKLKNIL